MKIDKFILWFGVILLLVGTITFGAAFALSGFRFDFLSNIKTVTKRFEESTDNPIQSVSIDFENANVEVRIENGTDAFAIEYPQLQNKKGENVSEIKLEEKNGAISIVENYQWQDHLFSWNFQNPTLVLYLPQERVYALDLQADTGEIRFTSGNLNVSKITLKATTGDISTKDCAISSTGEARFETTTGDINVGELSAQTVVLKTTTGDLTAHKALKAETSLSLKATTGTIKTLGAITAETITAQTSTGDLKLTGNVYANAITFKMTTGVLTARIAGKKADYSIVVSHSTGDSNLSTQTGGTKTLNVSCTTGDIYVVFAE